MANKRTNFKNNKINKKGTNSINKTVSKSNLDSINKPNIPLDPELNRKIQNMIHGGTDCIEVMGMINLKTNETHRVSKQEISELCNKMSNIKDISGK